MSDGAGGRRGAFQRTTRKTDVAVAWNLDDSGQAAIATARGGRRHFPFKRDARRRSVLIDKSF